MRVTWVQPEDLLPHELLASREEGRPVGDVEARWVAAGGPPRPPVGGASPEPASPRLRALADELLDVLERVAVPDSAEEPDELSAIRASWPTRLGPAGSGPAGSAAAGTGPAGTAAAGTGPAGDGPAGTAAAGPAPAGSAPAGSAPAGSGAAGSGAAGSGWAVPAGDRYDRLHGAWLGRAVGCLVGKPVEKVPRQGIREILEATGRWPLSDYFTAVGLPEDVAARWPWNRASRTTSLVENIDGMPEDDDLNYPLIALYLLERHGPEFTSDDVAKAWLDLLPGGRVFTAERIAYRNLLLGMDPPATARVRNPFRQWIGAQIRTDLYGWANPGRPDRAAEQAFRDARISHVRNGVYGAMYAAAMGAAAVVESDVNRVLDAGLAVVPPRSRFAEAVRFAREAAGRETDWERIADAIYDRYGDLHWVHVLPNAALLTAAIAYGAGDFERSIFAVVSGGWDTDSSGATVGGVLGALHGARALPERLVRPLHNRLASSVPGFAEAGGIGFDSLAERTLKVAS